MSISHHKQTIISHIVEEKIKKIKHKTKHLPLKAVLEIMIHSICTLL